MCVWIRTRSSIFLSCCVFNSASESSYRERTAKLVFNSESLVSREVGTSKLSFSLARSANSHQRCIELPPRTPGDCFLERVGGRKEIKASSAMRPHARSTVREGTPGRIRSADVVVSRWRESGNARRRAALFIMTNGKIISRRLQGERGMIFVFSISKSFRKVQRMTSYCWSSVFYRSKGLEKKVEQHKFN